MGKQNPHILVLSTVLQALINTHKNQVNAGNIVIITVRREMHRRFLSDLPKHRTSQKF